LFQFKPQTQGIPAGVPFNSGMMFYVVHVRTLNPAAAHVSDLKEPSILGVHFDPYPWGHHPKNRGILCW